MAVVVVCSSNMLPLLPRGLDASTKTAASNSSGSESENKKSTAPAFLASTIFTSHFKHLLRSFASRELNKFNSCASSSSSKKYRSGLIRKALARLLTISNVADWVLFKILFMELCATPLATATRRCVSSSFSCSIKALSLVCNCLLRFIRKLLHNRISVCGFSKSLTYLSNNNGDIHI